MACIVAVFTRDFRFSRRGLMTHDSYNNDSINYTNVYKDDKTTNTSVSQRSSDIRAVNTLVRVFLL